MRKKVIAAGHICLDITPVFGSDSVRSVSDILQPGKLLEMGAANVHTGGSVANTGLGMKLFGADVSLMGKIGADAFGDMVYRILQKYQAEEGLICAGQETTSYSVVLAIPGIDRIFLHHPGANHTFCAADIPSENLQEAALFHFGYPPLMRTMYEEEGRELTALFQKAKAAGCATSLDMAAVDEKSEAGQADWDRILQNVLPFTDFFLPSAEELCFMLDHERFLQWQERAGGRDITEILNIEQDICPLAEKCMNYGAGVLIIKCGAAGMYYRTAGQEVLKKTGEKVRLKAADWADKSGFECSYLPDRVLSGTGAGDISIAAFLTAMLEEDSLSECMHLAAAAGAACVASYDALGGLVSLEKLRSRIANGWKKQEGRIPC